MENKLFEPLINALILYYCVEYTKEKAKSDSLDWLDHIFLYIFIGEYILRYMACGLFNEKTGLLRDNFKIYDFTVVFLSFLYTFLLSEYNHYNMLIFRFIKIIKIFPFKHLTAIFEGIFSSVLGLTQIYIFFLIFAALFSFIGMVLFSGLLQYYCLDPITGLISNFADVCGEFKSCSLNEICVKSINSIDDDLTNFNDFLHAFLQVLRIMTFDNWSSLLKQIRSTWNLTAYLYFIPLTVFGNFLVINLFLAVLKSEFEQFQKKKKIKSNKNSIFVIKNNLTFRSSIGSFSKKNITNIVNYCQKNIGTHSSVTKLSKILTLEKVERGLSQLALTDNENNNGNSRTYRRFLMKMLYFQKYSDKFLSCFDKINDIVVDWWESYFVENIFELSKTNHLIPQPKYNEEDFPTVYDIFPTRKIKKDRIFMDYIDKRKRFINLLFDVSGYSSYFKEKIEKSEFQSKQSKLVLPLKKIRREINKQTGPVDTRLSIKFNKFDKNRGKTDAKNKRFIRKERNQMNTIIQENQNFSSLNYEMLKNIINENILESLKNKKDSEDDFEVPEYYYIIVIFLKKFKKFSLEKRPHAKCYKRQLLVRCKYYR